jgi:uncharacterized damage-inducible protein DinB
MKQSIWISAILVGLAMAAGLAPVRSQQKTAEKATIASVLDQQLSLGGSEIGAAAEAMPADKYDFSPTNGNFKGVRTFGQQVKHIASFNFLFYSTILGEKPPAGSGAEGPDSVKTKEQILKYFRDSYALGHRALVTITPENAATPLDHPPIPMFTTRLSYAVIGVVHANDHYGQMVEYLRMNGIVPPSTAQQQSRAPGSN